MANISERKNKAGEVVSYRIRVSAGYDGNGKKRKPHEMTWKPAPGMTRRQIEKELNRVAVQFEEQCAKGLASVRGATRLADLIPEYLETQRTVLAPRTYEQYEAFCAREIVPQLGTMKLNAIRPAHVQRFVEHLEAPREMPDGTQRTPSPSTVKRKLAILQSVFRFAVKLELIAASPADARRLTMPRCTAPKVEIFSREEAVHMLQCLEDEPLQYKVLIWLAVSTGCRCGELCALRFDDFDLETGRVQITKSAYKVKGGAIAVKPPKDYAARQISIDGTVCGLVRALQEDKRVQLSRLGTAWQEGGWLFTQWDGSPMHPQTPTRWWKKFLARHDIPHRKFHALRHTSATLLLYGGIDVRNVQGRLGHSSLAVTNRYLHCVEEADRRAASTLDQMLHPLPILHKKEA